MTAPTSGIKLALVQLLRYCPLNPINYVLGYIVTIRFEKYNKAATYNWAGCAQPYVGTALYKQCFQAS